jgi:hypothetical protein
MEPELNNQIELRLCLTEFEALLLIGCVRERAEEAERVRRLLPDVDPKRLEEWKRLASLVATAIRTAQNGRG